MAGQDEIIVEGKQYISSKRAAEITGYARDYIGQLARGEQIDAQRVGGLWYVSSDSLTAYKKSADEYVPEVPEAGVGQSKDLESYISFDGKDYVSANRASKITGYTQDYVGQLARSGKILSRQMGNRWYIERESILRHKEEKDSLLGAVQSQSVGIQLASPDLVAPKSKENSEFLNYVPENADLMPVLEQNKDTEGEGENEIPSNDHSIPIHVARKQEPIMQRSPYMPEGRRRPAKDIRKKRSIVPYVGAALTVVIVLSFGFISLKSDSMYTLKDKLFAGGGLKENLTASASSALNSIGDTFEHWFVPELVYKMPQ